MTSRSVSPGDVVKNSFGLEGIVYGEVPTPSPRWISAQIDRVEIENLGETDWWGVIVFGGGSILAAGPLLTRLRPATFDDFLEAVDTASAFGRERLMKAFPDYVGQLLSKRGSG